MHTRQGVAVPAHPNHSPDHEIATLNDLLARRWAPLEKLCPPGLCEQFMFMGVSNGIHLYKHVDSRRYLNVDVSGVPYGYNSAASSYYPISIAAAMRALETETLLEELFSPAERAALAIMFASVQVQP